MPHAVLAQARSAAWAFGALLAVACQAPGPWGSDGPAGGAPGDATQDAAAPASGQSAALAALPPRTPLVTPPVAPPINHDPARLLGLEPGVLAELMGEPALVRREATARVWQYRGSDCVLDIFLYDQAGSLAVTYLEARGGDAVKVDARPCLNEHLNRRRAAEASSSAP